jgi:putative phage-type endonuclease
MIKELAYQNKEEWLKLRKGYIGGSDAGAVLGLNPYKSAYTLWAEKTGKIPEFEGNTITRVGSYLEDLVATMFTEDTGKKVRRKNRILVNDDYPWACADVDRLIVGEDALLEIKTTNSPVAMKKFKNGEYPESWYCQMTHYLAVTGLKKAYLAVLSECRNFHVFELERDEEEIEALMNSEKAFWEDVKNDTAPLADGLESTSKTLTTLYPTSNAETVSLHTCEHELNQYIAISAQIKALEGIKDEMANKVKAILQEAGKGESTQYKVSWTTSERKSLDSKKLAQDHPEIDMNTYYKINTVRTFKVTEKKEDK